MSNAYNINDDQENDDDLPIEVTDEDSEGTITLVEAPSDEEIDRSVEEFIKNRDKKKSEDDEDDA